MKRNIDILVEIQRRIYKFKFTEDDIAVYVKFIRNSLR